MRNLHIYVPNLLKHAEHPDAKSLPALETWLSKARVRPVAQSRENVLANLWGVNQEHSLPIAAFTYLADIGNDLIQLQNQTWLRADPVHLQADQRFLRLFDADMLDLKTAEAQALCEALNEFYADDENGLHFIAATPTRWYLQLTHHQQLHTSPLSAVRGDHVQNYLPKGNDARWWQTRWNEIQMFLHQHPVNEKREAHGQLTVNSLWFWGEGKLPQQTLKTPWQQVFADDALNRGLSCWTQTPSTSVPDTAQKLLEYPCQNDVLCVLPALYDLPNLLEEIWFAPLLSALQQGHIGTLHLYPDNGKVYQLAPHHLWLFWRLRKPWFKC